MDTHPLVSILIPTFNRPHYFEQALKSALEQSYENIEVIVCDDSTNDETYNMIKPYTQKHSNLRYFKNETRLPGKGIGNAQKCLGLATGEYINYLMDDDLFHRDKIARMLPFFLEQDDISLVTSYRGIIDKDGNRLAPIPSSIQLFNKTTIMDGKALGKFILKYLLNVVGEPTTVLFRKKDIEGIFGSYSGKQYRCLVDLAMWLTLLYKGKAVYIPDTLSFFRVHPGQNTDDVSLMSLGILESYNLIKDSFSYGFFDNKDEYFESLRNWFIGNSSRIVNIHDHLKNNSDNLEISTTDICSCFNSVISELFSEDVNSVNGVLESIS